MDIRFIADRNLGTLAKWLRILGYDTLYERGNADLDFLRKADEEGRVALTRKRDLTRRSRPARLVLVKADRAPDQLAEVLEALAIIPDQRKRMTRCLRCNSALEEISKDMVEGLVPAYVYREYMQFRRCPLCERIFWPGTHRERVEERLTAQLPYRTVSCCQDIGRQIPPPIGGGR
jgi:uncharacterized protein with PIN domain